LKRICWKSWLFRSPILQISCLKDLFLPKIPQNHNWAMSSHFPSLLKQVNLPAVFLAHPETLIHQTHQINLWIFSLEEFQLSLSSIKEDHFSLFQTFINFQEFRPFSTFKVDLSKETEHLLFHMAWIDSGFHWYSQKRFYLWYDLTQKQETLLKNSNILLFSAFLFT